MIHIPHQTKPLLTCSSFKYLSSALPVSTEAKAEEQSDVTRRWRLATDADIGVNLRECDETENASVNVCDNSSSSANGAMLKRCTDVDPSSWSENGERRKCTVSRHFQQSLSSSSSQHR